MDDLLGWKIFTWNEQTKMLNGGYGKDWPTLKLHGVCDNIIEPVIVITEYETSQTISCTDEEILAPDKNQYRGGYSILNGLSNGISVFTHHYRNDSYGWVDLYNLDFINTHKSYKDTDCLEHIKDKPVDYCTCGIYSYTGTELRDIFWIVGTPTKYVPTIFAQVVSWGAVQEYEDGYRASDCHILKLYAMEGNLHASDIEAKYGMAVGTLKVTVDIQLTEPSITAK